MPSISGVLVQFFFSPSSLPPAARRAPSSPHVGKGMSSAADHEQAELLCHCCTREASVSSIAGARSAPPSPHVGESRRCCTWAWSSSFPRDGSAPPSPMNYASGAPPPPPLELTKSPAGGA
jgi:hypothetical protein